MGPHRASYGVGAKMPCEASILAHLLCSSSGAAKPNQTALYHLRLLAPIQRRLAHTSHLSHTRPLNTLYEDDGNGSGANGVIARCEGGTGALVDHRTQGQVC
jgi:hypothetical protein